MREPRYPLLRVVFISIAAQRRPSEPDRLSLQLGLVLFRLCELDKGAGRHLELLPEGEKSRGRPAGPATADLATRFQHSVRPW